MTMNIAVAGAAGRMGKMLIEAIRQSGDLVLSGALEHPSCPILGKDAGESLGLVCNVSITSDIAIALAKADVLIDFTRPEATLENMHYCAAKGIKLVIGTTGFSDADKQKIAAASAKTAIVFAPNMSIGVNATFKLLEIAAKILGDYDIEIIEAHHKHKVDAPSGTALKMGEVVAKALGRDLSKVGVFAREGVTGEREPSSIGFSTIRGGDIVGDHTVMFAGTGERIEITHRSNSRANYAQGSVRACQFLAAHSTGLFDMQDVLDLKNLKI
jgi:4-hydroxy-tetrahydrodipicolinate reductase